MITSYRVFSYTIPLLSQTAPREGYLLRLESKEGKKAWGEIAPLPHWSVESPSNALSQLLALRSLFLKHPSPEQLLSDPHLMSRLLPSVSFGLESALSSLYSSDTIASIPISGLLAGDYRAIQHTLPDLYSLGFTHIKLKLSSLSFTEARFIIEECKDHFSLRIDVNRNWESKKALSFFDSFPTGSFEYLEEPSQAPNELLSYLHPIALDESLRDHPLSFFDQIPSLKALIIKPTLQGGTLNLTPFASYAREKKLSFVLSSCYETGVALHSMAKWLSSLQLSIHAAGFDTYRHLSYDVLKQPHRIQEGVMHFSPIEVDMSKLTEVHYA